MALHLIAITPRHERRVRLSFSAPLAAGAFATGPYGLTCTNAAGVSPGLSAVLYVAGDTQQVELALAADLVSGGVYQLACTAVPAADASTFTGSQAFTFTTPQWTARPNVEPETQDVDALLFGTDLVWSGDDFAEAADGDLASVSGMPNAQLAVQRRVLGDPLPWAPDYSPRLHEMVDAPAASAVTARGRILAQVRQDDRVRSVDVTIRQDETTPSDVYADVDVVLIGNRRPGTFSVNVNR